MFVCCICNDCLSSLASRQFRHTSLINRKIASRRPLMHVSNASCEGDTCDCASGVGQLTTTLQSGVSVCMKGSLEEPWLTLFAASL